MEIKETGEKEFKIFKTVPESMKSVHFKNVLPYFLWYEFLVFCPLFTSLGINLNFLYNELIKYLADRNSNKTINVKQ